MISNHWLPLQFRKMLNKELSHFAESSKSGTQVSRFLINTYMDTDEDEGAALEIEVPVGEVSLPTVVCPILFFLSNRICHTTCSLMHLIRTPDFSACFLGCYRRAGLGENFALISH